ncbi:MAG: OmpA family protein [Siculibacillus sp.]
MAPWVKWLLSSGLIAAGATVVAGVLQFGPIATDVSSRALAKLKADGNGWAQVAISGRDVTLSGVAPEPAVRVLAAEATDRVFGVRVVDDQSTVLPLASPYAFSAERNGSTLRVTGAVPSEEARAAMLAAAAKAVPGATIKDELTVARGAPAAFTAWTTYALGQLSGLEQGTASFSGDGYSIVGKPRDYATWQILEKNLAAGLPKGLKLVEDGLIAPVPVPYRLGLTTRGATAVLDGYLPDAASRDRLLAALKARFTGGLDDRTSIAPGAPNGFVDTVFALLPGLSRLTDGGFELSGTTLGLEGGAPTGAILDQIMARIRSLLPSGFSLAATGGPVVLPPPAQVSPAECQASLAAVQTGEKILFETGKAVLSAESERVLDALVATSLKCMEAHVTVEGHTDSVGDPGANQLLSERRADAVVVYLVAGGIEIGRLAAVGYGADRPIADNATPEGRQMNRRIDFRVD